MEERRIGWIYGEIDRYWGGRGVVYVKSDGKRGVIGLTKAHKGEGETDTYTSIYIHPPQKYTEKRR